MHQAPDVKSAPRLASAIAPGQGPASPLAAALRRLAAGAAFVATAVPSGIVRCLEAEEAVAGCPASPFWIVPEIRFGPEDDGR